MSRFSLVIILNFFKANSMRVRMKKALKSPSLNRLEKYQICQDIAKEISKKSQAIVEVTGLNNLPNDDGYLLCPNHQGRFDGLAIIDTHDRALSFLEDYKRSDVSVQTYFTDLTESIRINRENPKLSLEALKIVETYLLEGKNVCIFPEGIYGDNKNTLNEFQSGSFHTIKNTKAPIIPVCCYDTHKIYNVTLLKKTKCSVHYLKPIYYDEYKDLSKQEIADLVKSRIQEKLDELNKLVLN